MTAPKSAPHAQPVLKINPAGGFYFSGLVPGVETQTQVVEISLGDAAVDGHIESLHPALVIKGSPHFSVRRGQALKIEAKVNLDVPHLIEGLPRLMVRIQTNSWVANLLVRYRLMVQQVGIPPLRLGEKAFIFQPSMLLEGSQIDRKSFTEFFWKGWIADWLEFGVQKFKSAGREDLGMIWQSYADQAQRIMAITDLAKDEIGRSQGVVRFLQVDPRFQYPKLDLNPDQGLAFGELQPRKSMPSQRVTVTNSGGSLLEGTIEPLAPILTFSANPTWGVLPGETLTFEARLDLDPPQMVAALPEVKFRVRANDGTDKTLPVTFSLPQHDVGIQPLEVSPGVFIQHPADLIELAERDWVTTTDNFWRGFINQWLQDGFEKFAGAALYDHAEEWGRYYTRAQEILGSYAAFPKRSVERSHGFIEFLSETAGFIPPFPRISPADGVDFGEVTLGQKDAVRILEITNTGGSILEGQVNSLDPALTITSSSTLSCKAGETARLDLKLMLDSSHLTAKMPEIFIQIQTNDGVVQTLPVHYQLKLDEVVTTPLRLGPGLSASHPDELAVLTPKILDVLVNYFWRGWIRDWLLREATRLKAAYHFEAYSVWDRYYQSAEAILKRSSSPPTDPVERCAGLMEFLRINPDFQPPKVRISPADGLDMGEIHTDQLSTPMMLAISNNGGSPLTGEIEALHPALRVPGNRQFTCQPGAVVQVEIRVQIDEAQTKTGLPELRLRLRHCAGAEIFVPVRYSLISRISFSPHRLDFDQENLLQPAVITIQNPGDDLLVGQIRLNEEWLWISAEEQSFTCRPGEKLTRLVHFIPTRAPNHAVESGEAIWLETNGGNFSLACSVASKLLDPGRQVREFAMDMPGLGTALAFSPDGELLACGGEDGWVHLLEVVSGDERRAWEAHNGRVNSLAFRPLDGGALASGGEDRIVKLWDMQHSILIRQFDRQSGEMSGVAISGSGTNQGASLLAAASLDQTVQIWDSQSGQFLRALMERSGPVYALAFAHDGSRLAWGSEGGIVRLWDGRTGQLLHTFRGHQGRVNSVAFSSDGRYLASGSDDRTIRIWDINEMALVVTLSGHSGRINSLAFSPDGRMLASGGLDKTVRLWDIDTQRQVLKIEASSHLVQCVAFSPDGKILASGSPSEGAVRLWWVG